MAHIPWLDAFVYMIPGGNTIAIGSERGWVTLPAAPIYNGAPIQTVPIADPARRAVYAYAPVGDVRSEALLYTWSGSSWTQMPPGHLLPGNCLPLGVDPIDNALILQQGRAFAKWDITGPSFAQYAPAPPFPSTPFGAAAFDPVRRTISTVHWISSTQVVMLEWDGASWSSYPAPDPGASPKCAFLPGVGTVLAGSSGVWVWKNQQWRASSLRFPPGALFRAMEYDRSRNRIRIVLIGSDSFQDIYVDDLRVSTTEPHPGMNVQFTVDSPAHAGQPWLLCLSTETWPGIPLAGLQPEPYRVLPLAQDALLLDSLSVGIRGFLDGQGGATAMLRVPNDQSLIGFHCFAAAISIAGNQQLGLVSRPVEINVLP